MSHSPRMDAFNFSDGPRPVHRLPHNFFDIPDSPKSFPMSPDDVDLYAIPDSPTILPLDRAELNLFSIPDSPTALPEAPVSHPMSHSPSLDAFDLPDSPNLFNIPDSPKSFPILPDDIDLYAIPDSPNIVPLDHAHLPPSPIEDLMDVCNIPPSPLPAADLHPAIPNTLPDAGPSMVDPQPQDESAPERHRMKILRQNLTPFLPVILSRASLLRAQLAQFITERDFIKGRHDDTVTHIAELDRYLYGVRALQLMRQEERHDEEAGM